MAAETPPPADRPEPQYDEILVPTDGTEGALQALDHAVAIARAFDGRIHAISVDEGAGGTHQDQMRTDSAETAEKMTNEVAERAKAQDVPVTSAVKSGRPKEEIVTYVEETDIDLIVMGTEGREGLKNVIFGSIAEETQREAPVPVLTVRPDTERS